MSENGVVLASCRRIGVLAVKEGSAHFEPLADLCIAGAIDIRIDRTLHSTTCPRPSPTSERDAPSAKWSSP